MYYRYGSYVHQANEITISISQKTTFSNRGLPLFTRRTHAIHSFLKSTDGTPATLALQLQALENAYAIQGQDAGLYFDQALTQPVSASHLLPTGIANGGVRVVVPPTFPKGDGTEIVTFRTLDIVLEADYPYNGNQIVDWQETIQLVGNMGPQIIWQETLEEQPLPQVTKQFTLQRATQQGYSLGLGAPLPYPAPIWPAFLQNENFSLGKNSPTFTAGTNWIYRRQWSYSFVGFGFANAEPTQI